MVKDIPKELVGLCLYEVDEDLIRKFPECLASWKVAYPRLDIQKEVRKAHSWEVSNNRKVLHARYLNNWMANADKYLPKPSIQVNMPTIPAGICALCRKLSGWVEETHMHERYGETKRLTRCKHGL